MRDFAYPLVDRRHYPEQVSTQPYEPDVVWPDSETEVDDVSDVPTEPDSEEERDRQAAEAAARKAARAAEEAKEGKRKREADPGEGSSNSRRRLSPDVPSSAGAWRAVAFERNRRARAKKFPGFERPEEPVAAAAAEEKKQEEEEEDDTMADDEGSDVESGPSAAGAPRARSQARFRIGKHSRGVDRKGKGKAGAVTKGSPGSGRRFEPRRFPIREIGDRHLDCLAGYMYRQTGTRFAVPGRDIPSGVSFFHYNLG